jgi:GT2 family glycosyltransferase
MIDIEDLPVGLAEIELTAAEPALTVTDGPVGASKMLALIRLHSHPVGVLVLDQSLGRTREAHAETIWNALGSQINDHLEEDGVPAVSSLKALASIADDKIPDCVRRRHGVLAEPPLITVAIATRDRTESLRGCLEALLRLDYPSYEIVVVDNAPTTSKTANLIADEFDSRVRYLREDRRGLANAHNCGLKAARGQIIAFVDDDVTVDRHWLTAIAEGFAVDSNVGCVTGLILPAQLQTAAQLLLEQHGGFDKGLSLRIFDTDRNRPEGFLFPFTAGQFGSGANMAFDTATLHRLDGFDSALGIGTFARGGDDLAGFFRVVAAGRQLVYQPAAVVWHRHHRNMEALRNQVYGYGVGVGAYLASSVVKEPKMLPQLVCRLPAGIAYAFRGSSVRNRRRYEGLPKEFSRLEQRGLMWGPIAYAVSRWRTWRENRRHGKG